MKKSLFGRAFALLSAGALVFAALGCDSGNDEYIEETPTNYYMDGFANAVADADVTINAVWNFEGWADGNPFAEKALAEATADIDAKKTGTGATLDVNNVKGKANTNVLQTSNATATLASLSESTYNFKLTTTAATNLVIKAKGAGAATAARLLAIADPAGTVLASKANMGNTTDVLFVVPGIAAGTYTIYANGVSIYYINAGAKEEDGVSAPTLVSKLELQLNGEKASDSPDSIKAKAILETIEFTVNSIDEEGTATDVTQDAVWTSSNENIAVVNAGTVTGVAKGTATIRARIGRFYDERVVTITESGITSSLTYISASKLPTKLTSLLDENGKAIEDGAKVYSALLTPIAVGNVKGTQAELTWADDISFAIAYADDGTAKEDGGRLIAQPKGKAGDSAQKYGLSWKDNYSSNVGKDDKTVATFTFKVTPTSGSLTLAQVDALAVSGKAGSSANNKVKLDVKVGNGESTQASFLKPAEKISVSDINAPINEETEIKVSVVLNNTNQASISLQDVILYFK